MKINSLDKIHTDGDDWITEKAALKLIKEAYMIGWEDGFIGGSDDPNVNESSAEEDFKAWQDGTRIE